MQQQPERASFAFLRPWPFVVGVALAVGGTLLALQASTTIWAQEGKKSGDDVQDELRKALDSLKNGPETPKDKDGEKAKPASDDLNPVDAIRQAEEAVRKAQQNLKNDPKSPEARKALEEASNNYQQLLKRARPNLQPFPIMPIDPEHLDQDIARFNQQMQQMMEDMQRGMQMFPMQPGFGPGGLQFAFPGNRLGMRQGGDFRLGVRLERPTPVLVDQLNLNADHGLVVSDVVPNSPADKAGIQPNDILLEIGGKPVPVDSLELQKLMQGFKADDKVDVVVMRKGKKETLKNISLPAPRQDFRAQQLNPRLRVPGPLVPEVFGPGGRLSMMSVSINNGEYTIRSTEDGVKYTIVGTRDDGGPVVSSIEVDEGGKVTKATAVDKLDEKYRPTVERLLKSIR